MNESEKDCNKSSGSPDFWQYWAMFVFLLMVFALVIGFMWVRNTNAGLDAADRRWEVQQATEFLKDDVARKEKDLDRLNDRYSDLYNKNVDLQEKYDVMKKEFDGSKHGP